MITTQHEVTYWQEGRSVCGIDEVGRGPLAGPLTLCGILMRSQRHDADLAQELIQSGLNDSKKLTKHSRVRLAQDIRAKHDLFKIVHLSTDEINTLGIMGAWKQGAEEIALWATGQGGNDTALLIDGKPVSFGTNGLSCRYIIRGDGQSVSIAAASVLAKVSRDHLMAELAHRYPTYGFEFHKGYGTPRHIEAIRAHGITPYHRTQFVQNILYSQNTV